MGAVADHSDENVLEKGVTVYVRGFLALVIWNLREEHPTGS